MERREKPDPESSVRHRIQQSVRNRNNEEKQTLPNSLRPTSSEPNSSSDPHYRRKQNRVSYPTMAPQIAVPYPKTKSDHIHIRQDRANQRRRPKSPIAAQLRP